MRDRVLWFCVGFLTVVFVLVCIGLVKTMNKADSQFDNPPTTGVTHEL